MNAMPADLPRVFHPEPKLAAVPTQPTAKTRETLPAEAPARTWSFIDSTSDKLLHHTCMPGCTNNHEDDRETPTHPHDITCNRDFPDLSLPVTTDSTGPGKCRVMGVSIQQRPFSDLIHERVPHAVVELIEDAHVEGLDPDGLATVILTLEAQLKQMRDVHAQLTALRAQGRVEL
ncbi:hypothetical protein AB0B78_13005 [Streptomyces sp. NPDC040724]|uniref:DUF6907 domain-containing protein n=1 Tax=Streptomyces sp. NPDC040724 TaxID=3155612 RepID=UPI003408263C